MEPRSGTTDRQATLTGRLRAEAAALLALTPAPGAALAVIIDGGPAKVTATGHADLAHTAPLAPDARFYLYSVTKTLLAIAALRFVEEGRLALDDPVRETLPEVPIDTAITLRQLLNHTSGLPDYGGLPDYHAAIEADPGRPWTPSEFLEHTLPRGQRFPPGQGWAYSNIGYLLIRMAVERLISGSLEDAIARFIAGPLGLTATSAARSLADARHLTPGYSTDLDLDGDLHDITRRYHPGWVSHGVVISTAAETATIVDALFAGRLVRPETLAAMREPILVPGTHPIARKPAYGLGLMLDLASAHGLAAGHAGGGPGFSLGAFHFSDVRGHRVTSVALVNADVPDLGFSIAFRFADAVADLAG